MADVSTRQRVDRGQIILVLGLLLAVMFVVMVTLLNSVIYAQNLASRGGEATSREPIEFRRTSVVAIGQVIEAENDEFYETDSAVEGNVTDDIEEMAAVLRQRYAVHGVAVSVTNLTFHEGIVLRQNESSRRMTNESDASDWTLVEGVKSVRAFRLNVSGGLASTTDPTKAFQVVVNDSDTEWKLAIYHNSSSGNLELAVFNATAGWTERVCSPPSSPPVRIDLTDGTVAGEECDAIEFAEGVSPPSDLSYFDGTDATGSYTLTVNVSDSGGVVESSFNGPGLAESPFFARAVYEAFVTLHYETPQITYETRVRVAPDDSDD